MVRDYVREVRALPAPRLAEYIRSELERQRHVTDPRRLDPAPADDGERKRVLASIETPAELMIDDHDHHLTR